MNLAVTTSNTYSLIDSGNGRRLEKFGNNTIVRPDSTCIWHPQEPQAEWLSANAVYNKKEGIKAAWLGKQALKTPWQCVFPLPGGPSGKGCRIVMSLRLGGSKNVGIFPEQQSNWDWIAQTLRRGPQAKVLNLFGYTGGATLAAAAQGAEVCHVDASKTAVTWARENQMLSGLEKAHIRWIEDDCLSFMKREIKRGVRYDAIIMDPPAFGRDHKGNPFSFEDQIHPLLKAARDLLSDKPRFFLINGYAMGYPADVLGNLVRQYFPKQEVECGELQIMQEDKSRVISCSIYARVTW
jgi:23S rRNA (cytosine1962-C5)-methyltransferase